MPFRPGADDDAVGIMKSDRCALAQEFGIGGDRGAGLSALFL